MIFDNIYDLTFNSEIGEIEIEITKAYNKILSSPKSGGSHAVG